MVHSVGQLRDLVVARAPRIVSVVDGGAGAVSEVGLKGSRVVDGLGLGGEASRSPAAVSRRRPQSELGEGVEAPYAAEPAVGFKSPLAVDANSGKVALVSGGGTGIGRAISLELARTGARVVIVGRRTEPLAETVALIEAVGSEALSVSADLREPENVDRVVDAALERFERIDILVNNAGGQFLAPATEITAKGWHAVFRLSLHAVFEMSRTVAVRSMIPNRGGVIVFIGVSPRRGLPSVAHAAAARAGAESLAATLACEWSQYGIRTVNIGVGSINSGHMLSNPDFAAKTAQTSLMGRIGHPEEIAAVVAFVVSSGGGFINGSTVVVDGGREASSYGDPAPPVVHRSNA